MKGKVSAAARTAPAASTHKASRHPRSVKFVPTPRWNTSNFLLSLLVPSVYEKRKRGLGWQRDPEIDPSPGRFRVDFHGKCSLGPGLGGQAGGGIDDAGRSDREEQVARGRRIRGAKRPAGMARRTRRRRAGRGRRRPGSAAERARGGRAGPPSPAPAPRSTSASRSIRDSG